MNLFALGSRPPALCFDPPPQTARLKVKRGTLRFAATVPGLQTTECGTGLAVSIGTPGARNSPLIEMGSISSVAVAASAPEASAQGFAGQIVLNPGGTTIVGGPSQVTMRATGGAALRATVSTGTGGQSLDVSGAAGSVITSAGERVPSEWARNSSIVVPLFGGVVTLAVAALSGAAQELMACVKGLRPRFRRLDGWLRGQHRPRPAAGTPRLRPRPTTNQGIRHEPRPGCGWHRGTGTARRLRDNVIHASASTGGDLRERRLGATGHSCRPGQNDLAWAAYHQPGHDSGLPRLGAGPRRDGGGRREVRAEGAV